MTLADEWVDVMLALVKVAGCEGEVSRDDLERLLALGLVEPCCGMPALTRRGCEVLGVKPD
jgi:hypothetical protein